MTPRIDFRATDTSYGDFLLLKETRYKSLHGAELPDDGLIDEVAVERRLAGQPARITPREVVCLVADAARHGRTDVEIAELLGRPDKLGADWVQSIRRRNRIDAGMPAGDGDALAERLARGTAAA